MPALAATALLGATLAIAPSALTFTHEPFEAGEILPCTHKLVNPESQDWEVVCKSADGKVTKRYGVHLWVTRYPHPTPPKLSVETLYWVTDWTVPASPVSNGTTTWAHLKDDTELYGMDLRQSVDNDTAGLYLKIKWK